MLQDDPKATVEQAEILKAWESPKVRKIAAKLAQEGSGITADASDFS